MTELEMQLLSALRKCRAELAIFLKASEHLTVRDNYAIQSADVAIRRAEALGKHPTEPVTDEELARELAGYVLRQCTEHLSLQGCEIDMDSDVLYMRSLIRDLREQFHLPEGGDSHEVSHDQLL